RVVADLVVDDHAAVAVIGVLAEADVGRDEHVRHGALDRPHRGLHRRVRIVRRRPDAVLVIGKAEQQHRTDAFAARAFVFLRRVVHREVEDAGHRADLAPDAAALADKQRQHEHVRRQPRLADERAHGVGPAEPPHAAGELQRGLRLRGIHKVAPGTRDSGLGARSKYFTIAATSAGTVYFSGITCVSMPNCEAASAVTGPIDATTVVRSRSAAGSAPSTLTRLRTADGLVNVTTSSLRSSSMR